MDDLYEELQGVASELLAEFRQGTVVLTRTIPGIPDPETPWVPGVPTVTTFTLDATVKGVSAQFIDGTTILASDREVTAAVFGSDPEPGDVMTIDGDDVTIIRTMRIPAAGTLAAWKFIVRG